MKAQQKNLVFYLSISALLVAIIGYNLWSYSCGRCTIASLMSLSAPAILLLFGIVIALLFLFIVKARNRKQLLQHRCACGADLREQWSFCPDCGKQRVKKHA